MSFTDDAWAATAPIMTAIDDLPFLRELEDGSLDRRRFTYYMAQDALYLGEYARVLAGLASMAPTADETLLWAGSAQGAITVERALHASHVDDIEAATMSPTCRAYTAYLASLLTRGEYAVAVAGVLPCFWIYQDVGERLLARIGDLTGHPYADWIAQYGDEAFAQSVAKAKAAADAAAENVGPAMRKRMIEAYTTAARYEWMFWDAAHREETWPV